ncbi:uncharacterized protein LOC123518800 isoform X2 [Portunus trituberculatus]|uniref:uncharacterized protein LOC123518800 isoform X2 n=1 Tax=Portunus trituberculatus TaxID=210409 RepID=UPI001E1CC4A9|nr:uncharacterized protein LOC123518800 isoform X2 [Portunus trituberculatus]
MSNYLFLKRMGREETFHLPPDKEKILIGRSPACDINFPSVYISRQHCQILRIPSGALVLKNIKNTNCTYINELKLQNTDVSAELQVGSCIGLGVPLEYATGAGMQNKDFVFLKLESSQPANETWNNARPENINAQIPPVSDASHPDDPGETATRQHDAVGSVEVSKPNSPASVACLEKLRLHLLSFKDNWKSESVPNQGVCSTSQVGPDVSKQDEKSQMPTTANNTLHMKDKASLSEVGLDTIRPPENKIKNIHPSEPDPRKLDNFPPPVQSIDSSLEPRQGLLEEDKSCIQADDSKMDVASSCKNLITEAEESHSPIHIDLTQADPDSPTSKIPMETHKGSFVSLLSSDEDCIFDDLLHMRSSLQSESKEVSGKRKRPSCVEPSSNISVTDNGEESSMKKKKRSLSLHSGMESDDESLFWKDGGIDELLEHNKRNKDNMNKNESNKVTEGNSGDHEMAHETKSTKNSTDVLMLSDDDDDNDLFLYKKKITDRKPDNSSQSKEKNDSESVILNTKNQKNLKRTISRTSSQESSSDNEPVTMRKTNKTRLIIESSDSDSDFEHVPCKRNSETLQNQKLKKVSVQLTRISFKVGSPSDASGACFSLKGASTSKSNNKENLLGNGKNQSSETCTGKKKPSLTLKKASHSNKGEEVKTQNITKEKRDGVQKERASDSSSSADLEKRNQLMESDKNFSKSNSGEIRKLNKQDSVEVKVEIPTDVKIKTEPLTSCDQENNYEKHEEKRDDDFMYSQVGDEIWLSSDEEGGSLPSGGAPVSPDADIIFMGEDEQPGFTVKEEPVEREEDCSGDVNKNDQWFSVLSQSFLEISDDEEEKDNEIYKEIAENAGESEAKPGPSGVSEHLPDSEGEEEWWPVLSQGFFDDDEEEEDNRKENAESNSKIELDTRDEPRTANINNLQSVVDKLKKAPPRTSQLTEAKIPVQHHGRKSRKERSNSTEVADVYPSTSENVKQAKISKKQYKSKDAGKVRNQHKQNKNSDLRKNLTSKYNLEPYKSTLEHRTKEKHHLVEKSETSMLPPLHSAVDKKSKVPPLDPAVNSKTLDPKSRKNISIQKKSKSADVSTEDKPRPKVVAKVTKKTRSEKLTDVDLFSFPSKTTSKQKNFKIPKSSNNGASCSSKSSKMAGSGLVLNRKKDVEVEISKKKDVEAESSRTKDTEAETSCGRSGNLSNDTLPGVPILSTSAARTNNNPVDKIGEINRGIMKINLKKSKPKSVRFPEKEEDLVKVLLISPRKKMERTGLPCVRASEMLPEELKLQRQNIPPYFMELFIHHICHWNYDWLECYHHAQEKYKAGALKGIPSPPPVVESTNCPILILYNSYNDYRETHSNLFYLELWEKIYNDWTKCRSSSNNFQALIEYVQPAFIRTKTCVLKFWAIKLVVAIPAKQGGHNHSFRQGTLISLKIRKEGKRSIIFGYVDHVMVNRSPAQNQVSSQMGPNLTLGVRVVKEIIQIGTVIAINDISYIRPNCRVWETLQKLPLSPLCKDILSPAPEAFSCDKKTEYLVKELPLNEAQRRAVTEVSSKCMFDPFVPKISLIHGPPGTGKTSTIVALITQMAMIGRKFVPVKMPRCKVLICAPSNAAVDELTLRLINLRDIGQSLRVVRVGFRSNDHPVVRNYALDQFVNKQVQMELSSPRTESARQELLRRKILVEQVVEDLERARREQRLNEVRQLEVRLNEMARAKAELERSFVNQPSAYEKHQLHQKWQQEFLLKAEVVATTLNSCVSGTIGDVLTRYPNHFTCCIVDEAGQCQETETLLPLLFGIRKLVLVGDHHQLPALVLSQLAQSKNLKKSLFERLHHRLVLELQREDVVNMLNVQYRMHPQIAEWPAYYFYQNKLRSEVTQPNTIFNPYMMFDLQTSQEQRHQNMELYNPAEASLVCLLLEVMQPHLVGKTIGVITPYQRQKFHLEEKLSRLKGKMNISINTIDGFQGQERDVIVLSFVRANNTASIGFLSHRQRLNVALTRAKEVCYIIASFSSLECNREWNSLINNARKRKVVCTIRSKEENDKAFIKNAITNKASV